MLPRLPGWADVLAGGLLPGLLAGTHLAGLIFFINPGLPFTPVPLLRGILVYAGLLGLVSLALHLPFTWRRPRRARRALPWGLTLALIAAALLDWTHASHYAYFLPPGINDRLIRTGLWLSLGALISFYTALLHTLQRRRYGIRSRTCYLVLALLSVYAMVERRESFRPRPGPGPRPMAVEAGQRPRLLVIGLDTATLDAVLPLASQGRLPFLAGILREGSYGRLESIGPPSREAQWATLATGKYPYKHGVTGRRVYPADFIAAGAELQLLPNWIGFRRWGTLGQELREPRGGVQREALTLWEILPRLGVSSGALGWPGSQPAKPGPAFVLGEDPGVEPPSEVEALFVALSSLRAVSRQDFGGFEAVQFGGSQDPGARAAAERVTAAYEEIDRALARQAATEGERPHLLVIVSASGAATRSRVRQLWGESGLEGTFEGNPDGLVLLRGGGIRPAALLTGARVVDLAPTILYSLGFPLARDLDGQVLTAAFTREFLARHPLTVLPSYEALAGTAP